MDNYERKDIEEFLYWKKSIKRKGFEDFLKGKRNTGKDCDLEDYYREEIQDCRRGKECKK